MSESIQSGSPDGESVSTVVKSGPEVIGFKIDWWPAKIVLVIVSVGFLVSVFLPYILDAVGIKL